MASGSSYPGTLDSWVDKLAGDYLTIADVNSRTSAIEKLEAGPLRPNDGSLAAPSYAFRSSANTGMLYSAGASRIVFSIGGFSSAGIFKTGSAVNYIALLGSASGTGAGVLAVGTDTNVDMLLQTQGTGQFLFSLGGTVKASLDSSGRFLLGHTVTAGSGSGDIILASQHSLRSVTSAGGQTAQILGLDVNDRLLIGGVNVNDIIWGKALVALGGGATATLSSIGGSGPTTAGQQFWMRIFDSTNNPFWVPAWK